MELLLQILWFTVLTLEYCHCFNFQQCKLQRYPDEDSGDNKFVVFHQSCNSSKILTHDKSSNLKILLRKHQGLNTTSQESIQWLTRALTEWGENKKSDIRSKQTLKSAIIHVLAYPSCYKIMSVNMDEQSVDLASYTKISINYFKVVGKSRLERPGKHSRSNCKASKVNVVIKRKNIPNAFDELGRVLNRMFIGKE